MDPVLSVINVNKKFDKTVVLDDFFLLIIKIRILPIAALKPM